MYSELIYTRCGEGIDILRGRNPIKNSGFKVFSCSENITEAGFTDLPFLYATAQSKEPYVDPSFMDDAYLYVVPDMGGKYLLDFHPIPFDRTATGDYSHRPGNFINQIFIGQFDDIYPYELFGNESVWDAKKKGEAFYYENAPMPLPLRDDLGETIGYITLDDIIAFVADGRREVLKSAIAFIVSQYSLQPEERKFLLIRDENSRQIELWIAAIESAFSPRMAAGLSFATRLDKFINANKYTVNLNGQYQTQINLQSPNQKVRLRAMIVGVDERDKTNTASAKALANSPFVVLDGKARTLTVSVDTSNPYYSFVTSYDERQESLCRDFMQMVDICSPSEDVLKLYSAFNSLSEYSSNKRLKDLLSALAVLRQFRLLKSPVLVKLYEEIKEGIPAFLKEDAVSSFTVMSWLESTAIVVGDDSAGESIKDAVCNSYIENVYSSPKMQSAKALHLEIKNSPFALPASVRLVDEKNADIYCATIDAYSPDDWVAFIEIFVDAIKITGKSDARTLNVFLPKGVNAMYVAGKEQNACRIVSLFSGFDKAQIIETLLDSARAYNNPGYNDFLINVICAVVPEVTSSDNNIIVFYNQLKQFGLEGRISIALSHKAATLSRPQDMDRFIDWILSNKEFKKVDISSTMENLDKKLSISNDKVGRLAAKIQKYKAKEDVCINSAHIYALDCLDDRNREDGLISILNNMIAQGFPSIEDDVYADCLVDRMFDMRLPEEVFSIMVSAASRSAFYASRIADEAMRFVGTKHDYMIGELLEVAAKDNSEEMYEALVASCAEIKHFDKGMSSIQKLIDSKAAQQYFGRIERKAREMHDQKKGSSFFGRLFS